MVLRIMAFLWVFWGPNAHAHTQSTAFVTLRIEADSINGEWHLALRDLEDAVGLDANEDGLITWEELRARRPAIDAYALSRLHIEGEAQHGNIRITDLLVDNHSDGAYAVLRFTVEGLRRTASIEVNYHALFDVDLRHRGLLRLERGGSTQLAVFAPESSSQRFDLPVSGAVGICFSEFVKEGVWHIWHGYDHILFLLALLLPGVLQRKDGAWEPVVATRPAVTNILKIVTAFTIAHSITLTLAATGAVQLSTRLIEPAIAASVMVAALNNLTPVFPERGWMAAFAFGLLHGFGFANALADLGLRHGQLAGSLFGFNLGVELGQLAIVALFLPPALNLRRLFLYPRVVLRLGSATIVLIAATWFAERVLEFKWLPF
jgi:hypothetical protein